MLRRLTRMVFVACDDIAFLFLRESDPSHLDGIRMLKYHIRVKAQAENGRLHPSSGRYVGVRIRL